MLTSYWLDKHRFGDLVSQWAGDVTLPAILRAAYGIELGYDWRGFSAVAAGLALTLRRAAGRPLLPRMDLAASCGGTMSRCRRRMVSGG